jgi:serine/threonine protein kinase
VTELPERSEYGEYEVESFLGKGSIGTVWLARHRRIGRRVALKTVQLDQKFEDDIDRNEFYRRLQREAELCGAMQHPNIVTLYDVGYDGELVSYFATEFVDGESLLARLRRTRPLPLGEAMAIASDILRGLTYAHSKGIIHRDIKPANILLTSEGQSKIADFGVARPLHSSLTATRSLVGTPNYMSPEQVKTAPVTTRADLFSAGVVMYEMLTGVKPFGAPELSGILYNVVNHTPPLLHEVNPSIPESVSKIVARLLAKKPDDRYASAADALADVEANLREPETSAVVTFETMGATPHEETSPLPTIVDDTRPPLLRRPVPATVFWLTTLLLASALTASIVTLRKTTSAQKPAGIITPQQLQAQQTKARALESARTLLRSGRYPEAVAAYDSIVARYPEILVARTERNEAARLLAEQSPPQSEVTKVATRKPRRDTASDAKKTEPKEEEKKMSRWQRFKRWWATPPKQ